MSDDTTLLSGAPTAQYLLKMPPQLKEAAETRARADGVSLADVVRAALACYLEPERLGYERPGQAVFNAALEVAPGRAEALRGSSFDPFHHDERLVPFLTELLRSGGGNA